MQEKVASPHKAEGLQLHKTLHHGLLVDGINVLISKRCC
jgi:hypothetical protein